MDIDTIALFSQPFSGREEQPETLAKPKPGAMRNLFTGVSLGEARISVPIARGKHLFPYRTQQLSLSAVTILGPEPWENSTVPYYMKAIRKDGFCFG